MMLVQVHNLTKFYHDHLVLDEVSFEIHSRDRFGLIGANGSGKSTLLKILIDEETDYEGLVQIKADVKIGYLRQNHLEVAPDVTAGEELLGEYAEWWQVKEKLVRLEEELAKGEAQDQVFTAYSRCHEEFDRLGGYNLLSEAELLFRRLGFEPGQWNQTYVTLSGGEKTRLVLGRVLLQQPDLLILDEPTNHTDVETMEWMVKVLEQFSGAVLLVSHDRFFLDQTVTKILELEDEQITLYFGNYSAYRQEKERILLEEKRQHEKMVKEKKRLQALARRQMEWFHKAHDAAGTDDFQRSKAKKLAARAKAYESRINQLTKKEIPKIKKLDKMNLEFGHSSKVAKDLVTFSEVGFGYPGQEELFQDLTFHIQRGDRLGIVGPNGSGKTTLLKLLLGKLEPVTGEIWINPHLQVGYFSQAMEEMDEKLTPMDILTREGVKPDLARNLLGNLQLRGDEVFGPLKNISMGERVRVALARLMLIQPDLLILDEPTNHLDIPGKERMEEALEQYPGTILLISHDRYLIRRLADKLLVLAEAKVTFYHGKYGEFEDAKSYHEPGDRLLLQLKLAEVTAKLMEEGITEDERLYLTMICDELQQQIRGGCVSEN